MFYVAVDVGCIECGEESAVLGIFTDEEVARAVCKEHAQRQSENWHGQHYFKVFTVNELDVENRVKY